MDRSGKSEFARGGDALHLRLETAGGVPIYLQLIEQIKYRIATGTLKAGDELPSVRTLASAQLINPNTVARAYLELEREGVIYKRRGLGTYVAEKGVSMSAEERLNVVRKLMEKALVEGTQLGLARTSMRRVFEETLKKFGRQRTRSC